MSSSVNKLDCLFPEKTLFLCGKLLTYRPFSLKRLFRTVNQFQTLVSFLERRGVSRSSFFSLENILKIIPVMYQPVANVLREEFGVKNIEELPIELFLLLLTKLVEINIESKNKFEKVLDEIGDSGKDKDNTIDIPRVVQELVQAGHSWYDIQEYSLAEVGVFLKAVIEKNKEESVEMLSNMWMGSNLTQEGFQKVIRELQVKTQKQEVSQQTIDANWRKLAALVSKLN